MIDLKTIPQTKEDLDSYEVNNIFRSWSESFERDDRDVKHYRQSLSLFHRKTGKIQLAEYFGVK